MAHSVFAVQASADITVLLDVEPELARSRKGAFTALEAGQKGTGSHDFITAQSGVRRALLDMAEQRRWQRIDTGSRNPDQVLTACLNLIRERLRSGYDEAGR